MGSNAIILEERASIVSGGAHMTTRSGRSLALCQPLPFVLINFETHHEASGIRRTSEVAIGQHGGAQGHDVNVLGAGHNYSGLSVGIALGSAAQARLQTRSNYLRWR
jgi:hypothetical protein